MERNILSSRDIAAQNVEGSRILEALLGFWKGEVNLRLTPAWGEEFSLVLSKEVFGTLDLLSVN